MAKIATKVAAKVAAKPAPTKAEKAPKEPKAPSTEQIGDLNRRISPSYRWIAGDIVRAAGTEGAPTDELIAQCHKAAKDAGLEAKDDAYWGRRLTRARALLRAAGLGVFQAQKLEKPESAKPVKQKRVAKAPKDAEFEDA